MSGARHAFDLPRGGAAVGFLAELPQFEAATVCYLRLYCAGNAGQEELRFALADIGAGPEVIEDFGEVVRLMIDGARRPLQRRHLGCGCVSGDESAFAHMVACAALGAREDAMLLASLLVRPEGWMPLAMMAERVGLTLAALHMRTPDIKTPRR